MEKNKSSQTLLLVVILVFAIGIFGIMAFVLYQTTQTNKALVSQLDQTKKKEDIAPTITHPDPTTSSSSLTLYKDSRLIDFNISYNDSLWLPKKLLEKENLTKGTIRYSGPGVLFEQINGNGILYFRFNLAFGVGGAMTPFSSTDVFKLQNGWARLQKDATSYYGLADRLVYYKDKPEDLSSAKDFCTKLQNGEEDIYPLFDKVQCASIQNGLFVGYAPQPLFTRSPRFKQAVSLSEISSAWAADSYVKETNIDDGFIIVEASYKGSSPEEADKLVELLNPSKENVTTEIAKALALKNNWNQWENLIVSISYNDSIYAKGGVNQKNAEAGGGYWFAKKVNGTWVIVADGNGVISCSSLAPYPDYPASLIPECWDEVKNTSVKR